MPPVAVPAPPRFIGRRRLHLPKTDSTSTQAWSYAHDRGQSGLAVSADFQTAGRGKPGRVWLAPSGCCAMVSVLLFPSETLHRPAILTVWAAVAVATTVEACLGRAATIKWPNDILVAGKKVCGILTECRGPAAVVGIGLNVSVPAESFSAYGLANAAALDQFAARPLELAAVRETLLDQLDAGWSDLAADRFAALTEAWERRSGLVGQLVEATTATGSVVGLLARMSFEGIELEKDDGSRCTIVPEAVTALRRAAAVR